MLVLVATEFDEIAVLQNRSNVAVLDVETTGLGKDAEVLSVAAINTAGRTLIDQRSMPEGPIPRAVTEVHGWTKRKLRRVNARPWPTVYEELTHALADVRRLIAWNAPFDRRLLAQTCDRHELEPITSAWIDLHAVYEDEFPGQPGSLAAAAARYGGRKPTHGALADCKALLDVLNGMARS